MTAYLNWHAHAAAHWPLNLRGLVIYCILIGIIGLVVATLIERQFEQWLF